MCVERRWEGGGKKEEGGKGGGNVVQTYDLTDEFVLTRQWMHLIS